SLFRESRNQGVYSPALATAVGEALPLANTVKPPRSIIVLEGENGLWHEALVRHAAGPLITRMTGPKDLRSGATSGGSDRPGARGGVPVLRTETPVSASKPGEERIHCLLSHGSR